MASNSDTLRTALQVFGCLLLLRGVAYAFAMDIYVPVIDEVFFALRDIAIVVLQAIHRFALPIIPY
jgi:hypothetical protein